MTPFTQEKEPEVIYWTHPDVWMPGLNNFKTPAKETEGNRNVVPLLNASNLMNCKEIKLNCVKRG